MTTPTLSKTLTPLDQISIRNNANYVDVCGVVVDSLPPTMTRTGGPSASSSPFC